MKMALTEDAVFPYLRSIALLKVFPLFPKNQKARLLTSIF